ncbi:MAG: hypothetical protein Q7R94_00245 [bacterium]|nr:hypothetical protein [bacterium]
MKYKLFVVCQLSIIIVGSVVPILASANGGVPTVPYWGPLVSCTGATCADLCDLLHTFVHIVYFGVTIAVFLVAPVLIAWGGIMIMLAGGNPGKLEEGKKIVTGTIIGIVLTVGALLIVKTFVSVLGVEKYISLTLNCAA